MGLEIVHLALVGRAHRAPRSVHHRRNVHSRLLRELGELAKAGFEIRSSVPDASLVRAMIERGELRAAPELLRIVGLRIRAFQREAFQKM